MSNWRMHIPEGTIDILPEFCMKKNDLENEILDVFGSYGYDAVETPVMQFYDVYDTNAGKIEQEMMFKFFDAEGRITVLRPDITTALARMVATKMTEEKGVIRLCYSGKVFRQVDSFASGQREFCQAGIELIGATGVEPDCEVISCAIESLMAAGLTEFLIEIGQVDFFKGLIEEGGFSADEAENLRILVDKKDCLAIKRFLNGKNIPDGISEALINLPNCFGEPSILDKINTENLGKRAKDAVNNLKSICKLLDDYGFGKFISVDLSLVKGINCYSGMMFRGITHGVGFSVCIGGRYDTLLAEYGNSRPAVGMSLGTDRILNVLENEKTDKNPPASDILIYGGDATMRFNLATALRNNGYVVEVYYQDGCPVEYAKQKLIKGALEIISEDKFVVYNTEDNSKTEGKILEILSGGDI